jgi:hypothetical protein
VAVGSSDSMVESTWAGENYIHFRRVSCESANTGRNTCKVSNCFGGATASNLILRGVHER